MRDIDDLGRLALDHRGAEHARSRAGKLDLEVLVDDVHDLVDDQRHGTTFVGEHQQRLHAFRLDAHVFIDRNERHELAAILHERAAARGLDRARVDLFEPRDQREQHGLGLRRARAKHQHRLSIGGTGLRNSRDWHVRRTDCSSAQCARERSSQVQCSRT